MDQHEQEQKRNQVRSNQTIKKISSEKKETERKVTNNEETEYMAAKILSGRSEILSLEQNDIADVFMILNANNMFQVERFKSRHTLHKVSRIFDANNRLQGEETISSLTHYKVRE